MACMTCATALMGCAPAEPNVAASLPADIHTKPAEQSPVFPARAANLAPSDPLIAGINVCAPDDTRSRVAVWQPVGNQYGYWTPEPPQNNGQIVYIKSSMEADDVDCTNEARNSFSFPVDPHKATEGGLNVIVQGNVQQANGLCHFSGFYINEEVFGVHQGWSSTSFIAIPTKDIVLSGKYCLERNPS